MKYRTAIFTETSLTYTEFNDLREAYAHRAELWKDHSKVAVQQYVCGRWGDVPYYQEHHLA